MKELLEQRLKVVLAKLDATAPDTVEHTELVKEMAAIIKTLGDLEKSNRSSAIDEAKLEFDKEKFDLERDKLELERDKFTQQQAEKLIETQNNNGKKWWEIGLSIAKLVLRGVEIVIAILALKYEIFNHISGKADWEAIRMVFKGE